MPGPAGASEALPARLALSCVSASLSEAATFPVDALKTQLQLQRSQQAGALALARRLVASQGLAALYAGVWPAMARHWLYTSTRITLYEQLRLWHAGQDGAPHAQLLAPGSLLANAAFGSAAGGLGQLVAVPADLLKVRMQADIRAASLAGQPRRVRSMRTLAASLLHAHGLAGLWRGGLPAVQRAALVNIGELSTFTAAKEAVAGSGRLPPGLATHVAASLASGLVSALISCPADVLKTRLMAQDHAPAAAASAAPAPAAAGAAPAPAAAAAAAGGPRYRGMLDCARQTVRQEGLGALWRGFLPTWLRLGPWQLVFWVSYEQLRALSGLAEF